MVESTSHYTLERFVGVVELLDILGGPILIVEFAVELENIPSRNPRQLSFQNDHAISPIYLSSLMALYLPQGYTKAKPFYHVP